MAWLQFILESSEETADAVSECLSEAGALAVTLQDAKDQPIFEPKLNTTPVWFHTRIIGLFDADIDVTTVKAFLNAHLSQEIAQTLSVEPLEDKDWIRSSMDQFQPMRFGENLWICPSWHDIPDPSAITILLDPGIAFGTGTHPTTALCLEWLDAHPPHDAVVIDYGCGSGILAIAALKLGAKKVYAIDHDPQALQSTQANAEKNRFDETVLTLSTDEQFQLPQSQKADLLMANILADPLIALAPTFAELIHKEGRLILSGILEHQIEALVSRYGSWFKIMDIEIKDDWVRIEASRL